MKIVVDTNVISYGIKADTRFNAYRRLMKGHRLYISFATLAELLAWTSYRNWGEPMKTELHRTLRRYRVVHSHTEMCKRWSLVSTEALRRGRPIAFADAWVAATALSLKAALLTHNVKDFEYIDGLTVLTANN